MQLPAPDGLKVARLGPGRFPSPLAEPEKLFIDAAAGVLLSPLLEDLRPFLEAGAEPPSFERAGPRSRLYFDPRAVTCGIVTCGGLCPGLNDVIRSIVLTLAQRYGVRKVLGFRYGYAGLGPACQFEPMELSPQSVDRIHQSGGTLLGSSRGPQEPAYMADTLVRHGVEILFAIGGDGTLRGASALDAELRRRDLSISVIGIPKTIDNDLQWTDRTFGFVTAVEAALKAVDAAHEEARGYLNGVGIVKLMGRLSGFIAAGTTLASADVNYCLVPEFPFVLEGESGFLRTLERRLDATRHALVVVAEGAGQEWLRDPAHVTRDASGNPTLEDIGVYLRDRVRDHFRRAGKPVSLKYIDPSYTIRSLPANAFDSAYCLILGQHAVHAGMAGRTDVMIGHWNGKFVHVPIRRGVASRKQVGVDLWQRVLEATGQPSSSRSADQELNRAGESATKNS